MRIPRRALAARTTEALIDRSIVVVAPAGYGKTTLIEDALSASKIRGAWVRCAPADRHAGRLLASLADAVNGVAPGTTEVVADAVEGGNAAPDPVTGARALLAECSQLLVDPIVVVVDDAEVLTGAETSCSVVAELIRGAGDKVGVVVLSRRSLPLRLGTPRADGRLLELGTGDLAFDATECGDLLESLGRAPSADDVDGLMTATEGWPLGIATLAETGAAHRRSQRADTSFRSTQALREFLREEVLAPLDDAQRKRLLASTVPRRLTPTVADALDLPDDHLAGAGTRGLFLHRLTSDADAFAYHPLFREVLLDQLTADLTTDEIRDIHRRVAPVVAVDDPVEGIEHWIAAEEWDPAIDAIATAVRSVAPMSPALVQSWLDRLPDGLRDDARVQLLAGHLARATGHYDVAVGHLRAGLGEDRIDGSSEWWGRFLLIDCLGLLGRPEEGIAIAEGFDEPEARAAGPAAAAAALYAAHGLASAGQSSTALALAARVRELPDAEAVDPIDALLRAYIDVPAGDLAQAEDRTLRAYRRVEAHDPLGMRLNLMAAHATVLSEQGRRGEALEWWERQRAEADRALMVARVNTICGLQAMLHAQMGQFADAEDHLAVHATTGTWADQSAHVARSLVAAGRGDRTTALSAAQMAVSAIGAPPLYQWWTSVDVVPALATVGALDRAEAVLDDAATLVDETYPGPAGRHLRARTSFLQAYVADERGELDRACSLVASGLATANGTAPEILRLEWSRIEPVVSAALQRGALAPAPTIEALWTAFPDGRALVSLADHPDSVVSSAAFRPALASGHPAARSIVAQAVDTDDPAVAAAARDAIARVADSPPPRQFMSLGGFRVRRGGWTTDERSWGRPVDARLLRFLLVHGEGPVPVDLVFEAIWPELDVDRARRSLQVATSRIRQLLDDPGSSASIVETGHGTCRLRLTGGDVLDWQEFERAADVALEGDAPSLPLLERARSLWGGEPLPEERYEDWAAGWRARLVDRCVDVLVALVHAHERAGDDASAIRVARELVDLDPYDERSHRLLMAALARAGRRGQALRQYLVCRRMLLDDLDVQPSEATSTLHAAILAGGAI
ncbi:BTAD domain-containing putative transcriptional regulator [Actinospongicola halichondriae]|uniref:BTAD domain-containing putative transcriptional regulator n=1 Tax=Actinospongicola halichondriae TaxID=3236844 RepID=UPI003D43A733